MEKALSDVTGIINKIIAEDDFPDAICPKFLLDAVKDYPNNAGKRLRPALLMWICGMLHGDVKKAEYAAAAVEIYHNWTLVHDDIIDRDNFRRGKSACHKRLADFSENEFKIDKKKARKFGNDFALLAGDIQQGWAVNMMLKSVDGGVEPELVLALLRRLQSSVCRPLISGQGLDMSYPFRNRDTLTYEEIENMYSMKTGALLGFCAEAGASIAMGTCNFDDERIVSLFRMAVMAGLSFQLRDDWIGVFGSEAKTGKPIFSDFIESKPTAMLIYALDNLDRNKRKELESMIGLESYDPDAITKIRTLIIESGAERFVLDKAELYINSAKDILTSFEDNRYRELLLELMDFIIQREK